LNLIGLPVRPSVIQTQVTITRDNLAVKLTPTLFRHHQGHVSHSTAYTLVKIPVSEAGIWKPNITSWND